MIHILSGVTSSVNVDIVIVGAYFLDRAGKQKRDEREGKEKKEEETERNTASSSN